MVASTESKSENGSGIPGVQTMGTTPADNKVLNSEHIKPAVRDAVIIDADLMNSALLAARDPRAALLRIRALTAQAKYAIKVGRHSDAFTALNQISALTGAL